MKQKTETLVKKFWKRGFAAALCGVLGMTSLVGCGAQRGDSGNGKVIISIADYFADEATQPEIYKSQLEIVKKFEEKYPNVKVENAKWNFDVQSYMAKAEGGTLPTVYYIPLTEAGKIMELGYAADLTQELQDRGIYENIAPFALENISYNGKIYFLPQSNYDQGIIVNIDLYKKAGYVAEDGTLYQPKTWEELAEIAAKIKETTGVDGFILPTTKNGGGWRFTTIAWGYGTVFEEKVDGKWKAAFNSPECIQAMEFIRDLKWKYDILPSNTLVDNNEVRKQIGTGAAAMTLAEPNLIKRCVTEYNMDKNNIGVLGIPAGPKRRVSLMGGGYKVVDRNTTPEQLKAAMDWLEYTGVTTNLTDEVKENLDKEMETAIASGEVIGLESLSPWKSTCEVENYRRQLYKENMNVAESQIALYNDKTGVEFQAEEEVEAQQLYALMDTVIQEVLTHENADVSALIQKAAEDFQKNSLDYAK